MLSSIFHTNLHSTFSTFLTFHLLIFSCFVQFVLFRSKRPPLKISSSAHITFIHDRRYYCVDQHYLFSVLISPFLLPPSLPGFFVFAKTGHPPTCRRYSAPATTHHPFRCSLHARNPTQTELIHPTPRQLLQGKKTFKRKVQCSYSERPSHKTSQKTFHHASSRGSRKTQQHSFNRSNPSTVANQSLHCQWWAQGRRFSHQGRKLGQPYPGRGYSDTLSLFPSVC